MKKFENIGIRRLLLELKRAYYNGETHQAEIVLNHIRKNMNENEILKIDMDIKLDDRIISSKSLEIKKLYTFEEIINKFIKSKE